MKERVWYLAGVACPYDKAHIALEHERNQEEITHLKESGVEVVEIGSSHFGFTLTDLERPFREVKAGDTVIVDVHGNTETSNHYLAIGRDSDKSKTQYIWVEQLYQCMARASGYTPLNIFMFSCGSGDGYEAVPLLPKGSTVFNLTEQGMVNSYWLGIDAYKVPAHPDRSFAERFFLNVLLQGLTEDVLHVPRLAISADGDPSENLWTLWDLASTAADSHRMLSQCRKNKADDFFAGLMNPDDILKTVKEIEFRRWGWQHCRDLRKYKEQPNMHGPICALGYYLNRKRIGAFQTQTAEHLPHPFG